MGADEGRTPQQVSAWQNPTAYIQAVKRFYRRDRWADQPGRVLVVSEKSTVKGTLDPILDKYGVPFLPWHGYISASAVHTVPVTNGLLDGWYIMWRPQRELTHRGTLRLSGRFERHDVDVEFHFRRLG